ncbi:hypothetical protein MA16_Dca019106 [Dendrobium catenatum]|uniref:Uncharacterized protein n=1 Tax=Dendrobium catenatum TaxID=906689 RepID=A0A2I0WPA1_9ASPA|nr:hypothetical protein MA16_Dca019106 [Dendrobium catenatum]
MLVSFSKELEQWFLQVNPSFWGEIIRCGINQSWWQINKVSAAVNTFLHLLDNAKQEQHRSSRRGRKVR